MTKQKTYFEQVPVTIAKKAAELEPGKPKLAKLASSPKNRSTHQAGGAYVA
jgi:hypothetical protein